MRRGKQNRPRRLAGQRSAKRKRTQTLKAAKRPVGIVGYPARPDRIRRGRRRVYTAGKQVRLGD